MHQIDHLSWLIGHWTGQDDQGQIEAHWAFENATALVGIGCTRLDGRKVHQERMRIEQQGSILVYHFMPEGRPEIQFESVSIEEFSVDFENCGSGFPHRIDYRRDDTSLIATIEDAAGDRQMSWVWQLNDAD